MKNQDKDLNKNGYNNDKNNKSKLIIYIILSLLLIAILVVSLVLFYENEKKSGDVNISGKEVDITVSAQISGFKDAPILDDIVINENTLSSQGWHNLELKFDDKTSVITLVITVVNNSQSEAVNISFINNTTTNNITIDEYYYFNGNSETTYPMSPAQTITSGGSCTYNISFEILDQSLSVQDILDIQLVCTNGF